MKQILGSRSAELKAANIRVGRAAKQNKDALLATVRTDAKRCRACPLWKMGTQTVFGEGPADARILLVGEQPGDQEDLQGRPFVGPAGQLLDRALDEVGIPRERVYVTNAVKHFKHELRGKRRIHKSPAQREVLACNRWLQAEVSIVQPALIIALGVTAARAVFGRPVTIKETRGQLLTSSDSLKHTCVLVTVHPSFLLRMPHGDRAAAMKEFLKDLRIASPFAKDQRSAPTTAH